MEKILLGSTFPPLEMDDEETEDYIEKSSILFDVSELIESIGKKDFKSLYRLYINDFKSKTILEQREICIKILNKFNEVYEYEFLPPPKLEHQMDMDDVYEFIRFIEYHHISFLGDVWMFLLDGKDFRKVDIEIFIKKNEDKILKEIEDQCTNRDQSQLISIFLRTYIKEKLLEWFVIKSVKSKMLIMLKIEEERGEL